MNLKDFSDVEYINLITYKKDKTPITTPVWVADFSNSLVVTTSLNAEKVKRVRNNGKATIYITNQNGSKVIRKPRSKSISYRGCGFEKTGCRYNQEKIWHDGKNDYERP